MSGSKEEGNYLKAGDVEWAMVRLEREWISEGVKVEEVGAARLAMRI